MGLLVITASIWMALCSEALAKKKQKAHTHGRAIVNVVLEGTKINAQLKSPAEAIVGFEHKPRTKQQKAAIRKAQKILNKGSNVVTFDPLAQCKPLKAKLDSELLEDDHDKHHKDHHDHDKNHHDHGQHAEFEAEYDFSCKKPKSIKSLTVPLFKHFPAVKLVIVNAVIGQNQIQRKVTAKKPIVSLRD